MTDTAHTEFRRLVLDLCAITTDGDVMRMAADLARLLHLDLQGLYVEDPALALLAGLPCVRELRLPGQGWEKLDADRITAEVQQAVARAARRLAEIAAAAGVSSGFETRRGNAMEIIAGFAPSDIVLLVEPRLAGDRMGGEFTARCRAAYHSCASVLLMPAVAPRAHGAVVAVVSSTEEAGFTAAAHIARISGEELVLLVSGALTPTQARERALECGLRATHVRLRPLPAPDTAGIARALAGLHPRLLVLTRGSTLGEDFGFLLRLAGERGVPVLAVEPPHQAH